MNPNPDRLDDAIDLVAARMIKVAEDDGLAMRIANALPERSKWSLHWLMPRLAITAALALVTAGYFIQTSDDQTVASPAESAHHNVSATAPVPGRLATTQPAEAVRQRATVRSAFRRTRSESGSEVDRPDHERSLPAIASVAALDISEIAPASLPEDAPLTVESLQIADLPLTAEFSPH